MLPKDGISGQLPGQRSSSPSTSGQDPKAYYYIRYLCGCVYVQLKDLVVCTVLWCEIVVLPPFFSVRDVEMGHRPAGRGQTHSGGVTAQEAVNLGRHAYLDPSRQDDQMRDLV